MTSYLLELSQGVVLLTLGWIGVAVTGVRNELRTLNGRVIRHEQWRHDKEASDATTNAATRKRLDGLAEESSQHYITSGAIGERVARLEG